MEPGEKITCPKCSQPFTPVEFHRHKHGCRHPKTKSARGSKPAAAKGATRRGAPKPLTAVGLRDFHDGILAAHKTYGRAEIALDAAKKRASEAKAQSTAEHAKLLDATATEDGKSMAELKKWSGRIKTVRKAVVKADDAQIKAAKSRDKAKEGRNAALATLLALVNDEATGQGRLFV